MAQPRKRATSKRKCKCKVSVRQSLEMRKKGQQIAKNDTLPKVQGRPPADNSATIKVKIRRK